MKQVILAEKPSQAKSYAEAFNKSERKDGFYKVDGLLNGETIITYGFGHLVELYSPAEYKKEWEKWNLENLPIFPEQYKFKVSKDKKKQYNIVKKHLDSADEIIIATDGDREGEAIARLIIRLSGNNQKQIKRLWINSLETEEIKNGFKNLKNGNDYYSMFKSAETRQIADWLVGMNLTQLYTLNMQKNGLKGVFSIGRVQTPTLYLIYQRNKEIEQFVSKSFYELYANFEHELGTYKGKYKERFDTKEELEEFKEQQKLLETEQAQVINKEIKEKKTFAPKLFSLSDLQTYANKKFKYGAKKTLEIAQKLYEKKVLSYPRTDNNYIGTPEFNYLKENLDKYLSLNNLTIEEPQLEENKRYVNSKKVEEHYAIIPTRTTPEIAKLSKEEKNIYLAVLNRTIAIFEKPFIYDETTIETKIADVSFMTKGKTIKERGWKRIFQEKEKEEKPLPEVKEDDNCNFKLEDKKGKTQPPKYFTEGSLLTAMKQVGRKAEEKEVQDILKAVEGIGTEATRANIIETLKHQKYIENKKSKIYITEKGKLLCDMIKNDEIANPEMTATWERYLKQIQENKGTQEAFLESIERFIEHLIEQVPKNFEEQQGNIQKRAKKTKNEKEVGICPECQNSVIDKGKFYGCSNYPSCKFTLSKDFRKKKLTKKNIKDLLTKKETIVKGIKSKNGNKYNAKVNMNDKNYVQFIEFAK